MKYIFVFPLIFVMVFLSPYVCKNILGQSGLEEDVLYFYPGYESVSVTVRLPEEGVVSQLLPSVHYPGHGLDRLGGGCRGRL